MTTPIPFIDIYPFHGSEKRFRTPEINWLSLQRAQILESRDRQDAESPDQFGNLLIRTERTTKPVVGEYNLGWEYCMRVCPCKAPLVTGGFGCVWKLARLVTIFSPFGIHVCMYVCIGIRPR